MSEVVGERGVGRAEVRVGRMVRKREKREMEREVVVGEEGSIFLVFLFGVWFWGRGYLLVLLVLVLLVVLLLVVLLLV